MSRLSDRGFTIGCHVIITNADCNNGTDFQNGVICELIHDDGSLCCKYRNVRTGKELYLNLEEIKLVPQPVTMPNTPATRLGYKVGDKFVCLTGSRSGTVVTLCRDDASHIPYFEDSQGRVFAAGLADVRPATQDDIDKASGTPFGAKGWNSETVFRVKRSHDAGLNIKDGEIVKLDHDDHSHNPRFKVISTGTLGYVNLSDLEVYAPTPCELAGYKTGDFFVATVDTNGFQRGYAMMLHRDDRSNQPYFIGYNSEFNGGQGAYTLLHSVRKITKDEAKAIVTASDLSLKRTPVEIVKALLQA